MEINSLSETVDLHPIALGDSTGDISIGRECQDGCETGNAFVADSGSTSAMDLDWSVAPMRRLDDYFPSLGLDRVDLIKIDVEGAELNVLRGATCLLESFRPVIYGEFHAQLMSRFAVSFADVGSLVEASGYRAFAFVGRLKLAPVPFQAGRGNAVLCPAEKVDWLPGRCEDLAASSS